MTIIKTKIKQKINLKLRKTMLNKFIYKLSIKKIMKYLNNQYRMKARKFMMVKFKKLIKIQKNNKKLNYLTKNKNGLIKTASQIMTNNNKKYLNKNLRSK